MPEGLPIRDPAAGRRRGWHSLLAVVATAVALGILFVFLVRERDYVAAHFAASPRALLAIAASVLLTLAARSRSHQVLFERLGVDSTAADWFRVVTMSSFTNYLPLSAGMVAKAYFLKRIHALPYRTFAVGQVALLVIVVSTNGAVGLATLAARLPEHLVGAVGLGFAAMFAATILLLLPPRWLRLPGAAGRAAWWDPTSLPALRRGWPAAAAWQVGNLLATAWGLKLAFAMGSAPVGFGACLVFSAAAMLTRFVAITPGAIGIREFLIGGLAHLTGFDLRDAVIASSVTRTVEIAVIFALGGAFTYGLSNRVAASYAPDASAGPEGSEDESGPGGS